MFNRNHIKYVIRTGLTLNVYKGKDHVTYSVWSNDYLLKLYLFNMVTEKVIL